MTAKVFAKEPLAASDLKKIADIRRESECPHESLMQTFIRYIGTDSHGIHFDSWSAGEHEYTVE